MSATPPPAGWSNWSLADRLAVAVIVGRRDGSAAFANQAWTAMTGQMCPEWGGEGWFDVLDITDRQSRRTELVACLERGEVYEADWRLCAQARQRVLHVVAGPDHHDRSVPGFVATVSDVTDDRARTARLSHLASHDPLTGLYNRAQFLEFVEFALARQRRPPHRPAAVLFLDVDDLKRVNDRFGHAAGDDLLRTVAARISAAVRPGDVVARYGGDEFTVLCEDIRDAEEAALIVGRVRDATLGEGENGGSQPSSVSIGFALADDPDRGPDAIIANADHAMYSVKREVRGQVPIQHDDPDATERRPAGRDPAGRRGAKLSRDLRRW